MNVKLIRLNELGKRRELNEHVTFLGDLNLSSGRHLVLNRHCTEASLLDDKGVSVVPNMIDCTVMGIYAKTMSIVGIEVIDGTQYAQEWCVLFETIKLD